MNIRTLARRALLALQAVVAITAVAGGVALVVGATVPALSTVLVPPAEYLEGSPFTSYAVPGILLAVVIGGTHALAFVTLARRTRWGPFLSAATAFGILIWIFVQMLVIPFSPLQAVYFAAGIGEAGLLMVYLGLFDRPAQPRGRSRTARASSL